MATNADLDNINKKIQDLKAQAKLRDWYGDEDFWNLVDELLDSRDVKIRMNGYKLRRLGQQHEDILRNLQ